MNPREAMEKVSSLLDSCKAEDNLKPRPKVAALIINSEGVLLGSAYRGEVKPGEHAEYTLLERILCDVDLTGSTAFVSLEPCSLRGHTKVPCAQRLIDRKIKTVYIANLDPNPFIRGNGIQRLIKSGVDVRFFENDIAQEIENKNKEFIDEYYSDTIYKIDEFVKLSKDRSLDEWLQSIRKIYQERNYAFPISAIYMHLIEAVGDLVNHLADTQKLSVPTYERLIAKSFAWWLAVCNKAGIDSVEKMILLKFPEICPYCKQRTHDNKICKKDSEFSEIDWQHLFDQYSRLNQSKRNLGDFAKMFETIYGESANLTFSQAKLVEELGELAESCRYLSEHRGYFWSESADVFAWLLSIHNYVNSQILRHLGTEVDLNSALSKYYPDACRDCGQIRCGCPPLLKSEVSRLALESPDEEILMRMLA